MSATRRKLCRRYALPAAVLAVALASTAAQADPDCSGPDHWPAGMAFTELKNSGVLTNAQVIFASVKSRQIVSQKVGPDRYRQVFDITFPLKGGKVIEAIAISDASSDECSIGPIRILRVVAVPE